MISFEPKGIRIKYFVTGLSLACLRHVWAQRGRGRCEFVYFKQPRPKENKMVTARKPQKIKYLSA